ncbi:putative alkaline shock family protein YloU [Actinomycetospora succinea]|uniref:Putative alkaline shock family protein YloU n=1 Tax=Actinomycetospora succinea TaxID=663603 RepID=A0A4R6UHN3_9PSEU|nr:Asp23/Gls24 family envelope stress response protein [Actinomycetospora succinea]TDQ46381.1 putative alkaline shock family protein YloU [Actinomycetospora succinea]
MTTPDTGVGHEPGAHPSQALEKRLVATTVNTPSPTTGRHAAPEETDDRSTDDAAERGSLTIHDVVVEKVATAAASEVEHVGGATRRVLGVPTGHEDGDGRPRVSAKVSGQLTSLEIRLAVAYPASVRATTEAVRAHVRDRLQELTELTVTRVDITVAALTATRTSAKRVVA